MRGTNHYSSRPDPRQGVHNLATSQKAASRLPIREDVIIGRKGSRVMRSVKEMPSSMPSALTFRAAIGAAAVLLIVAIAAIVNHFTPHTPHPVFGLKVGLLLILCALACGIWANYNRPASRA